MLAAMTHPSRVLNLDMKAKALYAKELYICIYFWLRDCEQFVTFCFGRIKKLKSREIKSRENKC